MLATHYLLKHGELCVILIRIFVRDINNPEFGVKSAMVRLVGKVQSYGLSEDQKVVVLQDGYGDGI